MHDPETQPRIEAAAIPGPVRRCTSKSADRALALALLALEESDSRRAPRLRPEPLSPLAPHRERTPNAAGHMANIRAKVARAVRDYHRQQRRAAEAAKRAGTAQATAATEGEE